MYFFRNSHFIKYMLIFVLFEYCINYSFIYKTASLTIKLHFNLDGGFMKISKRIISFVLVITMVMCFLFCSYATTLPYDSLTMTPGGHYYIYSNCPESVNSSVLGSTGATYTINTTLTSGNTYDVEYYHINYTGSTLRAGVIVINNGSTTAQFTVKNYAKTTRVPNGDRATHAYMQNSYQNSTNNQTYVLQPGESRIIDYVETSIPANNVGNGKVKVQANSSSLGLKIYLANSSASQSTIQSCARCSQNNDTTHTTGLFAKDSRSVSFDVGNSTTNSFYLAAYNSSTNTNELSDYINPYGDVGTIGRGPSQLAGNYGVRYDVQLTNYGTKNKIKITYDYASHGSSAVDLEAISFYNGSSWEKISLTNTSSGCYVYKSIPSNGAFKFILPGGNCCNINFKIE